MRTLISGLAMSLACIASDGKAEITVDVDGTEYTLSTLMENCKSMSGAPEAQVSCFNALSELLKKQGDGATDSGGPVTEALSALQSIAQYNDDESGLSITGAGCEIQIVYFTNYFHISRRNVSTIDLYSAKFDVSKLQHDKTAPVRGAQAPLEKGVMDDGITAETRGGPALDSTEYNFASRSARTTIDAYAAEVVEQLPASEGQEFNFVLVHPQMNDSIDAIWSAFDNFVAECKK